VAGRGRSAEDLGSLRTVAVAATGALGALAAFGVTVGGPVWLKVAAAGLAVGSALVALVLHVAERRASVRERGGTDALAVPQGLSSERLEEWRVRLRAAVLEARIEDGGQLDQMVHYGEAIDVKVKRFDIDSRRPRLRVGGRLLAWSEIRRQWDESTGRLVILGDPGYGKTVAALTLVAHVNARAEPGASVAELFSLADWYHWIGDHAGAPFGGWLADQLTLTHPELPLGVSRLLIAAGLVLPILDGLDEIPTRSQRRACIDAIDSYARRTDPHRPFVLTSRGAAYVELAPDQVSAERHIVLAGLQPDQVAAILDERTGGREGWDTIRARHAAGDATLRALFRSPLRLTVALQAYRDRDPGELLVLRGAQAQGKVWELLLTNTADVFDDARPEQVRAWLAFLAAGMRRSGRQRLMLHELYLIDPDHAGNLRRFRLLVGLIVALVYALGSGLIFPTAGGSADWLVFPIFGMLVGFFFAIVFSAVPKTRVSIGWRTRIQHATNREGRGIALQVAAMTGASLGVAGGMGVFKATEFEGASRFRAAMVAGLVLMLFGVLVGALAGLLNRVASHGSEVVDAEPPARFAHTRPDAVLVASRNRGIVTAVITGVVVAVGVVLVGWLAG
jgi:hypothetical protein